MKSIHNVKRVVDEAHHPATPQSSSRLCYDRALESNTFLGEIEPSTNRNGKLTLAEAIARFNVNAGGTPRFNKPRPTP